MPIDKIKIVCRALVIDAQNQVLFVKKTNSHFWSLPGGKLDADDVSVQACLVRELQEELSVDAVIQRIRFVHELHKNDTRYVELIWQATLASDPVRIGENIYETSGNELTDIQWIKKDDLRDANIKPEFLKTLFEGTGSSFDSNAETYN
jgi:8-oxo-dGTP pyrophosphatase MutT (NUDIX family)